MRANLLDADDEARARQRAMDNLGSLMASGQAGALNAVPPDLLPMLLRLPSTSGNVDALRQCADGINDWKASLARGLLPSAETRWPDDPIFREALLDALGDLDMARFTRQFPPVLDTLMKNILDILYVYEQQKADEDGTEEEQSPARRRRTAAARARTATTASPRMATPKATAAAAAPTATTTRKAPRGTRRGAVVAMTTATTGMGVRLTWRTSISPWRVRRMGTTAMTPRARRRARGGARAEQRTRARSDGRFQERLGTGG